MSAELFLGIEVDPHGKKYLVEKKTESVSLLEEDEKGFEVQTGFTPHLTASDCFSLSNHHSHSYGHDFSCQLCPDHLFGYTFRKCAESGFCQRLDRWKVTD